MTDSKKKLYVYKLEKNDEKEIDFQIEDNLSMSESINLPLLSLGFHNYYYRTQLTFINGKKNMSKELNNDIICYDIVNKINNTIANYEDDLNNYYKIFFDIKDDINIINSNVFYNIWEILFIFNFIDDTILNTAIISNDTSPIIQAIVNYRKKYNYYKSDDIIYTVNINDEYSMEEYSDEKLLGYYNDLYKSISNSKLKKKLNIIDLNKKKGKNDKLTNLKKIVEKENKYVNLIISDFTLKWKNELHKEQEFYEIFIKSIVNALKIQAKNGNFIIKIFETLTKVSLKLIHILTFLYDEVFIVKPYFSKQYDSEKYLILKNFKFNYEDKEDKNKLNKFLLSLESIIKNIDNSKYIFDIYSNITIPNNLIEIFKTINTDIGNQQQIVLNEIIKYINEKNFFGDKYHKFKDIQIESTMWWISNFFPSNNLLEKNKEFFKELYSL